MNAKPIDLKNLVTLALLTVLFMAAQVYADKAQDIKNLSDNDVRTRRKAVKELKVLPQDKEAFDALCGAYGNEPDAVTRMAMLETVTVLDSNGALPVLLEGLDDPNLEVRKQAAGLLGGYGDNPEIMKAFDRVLSDPGTDDELKLLILDTLGSKTGAETIISKSANSKNKKVRDAALNSLNRSIVYGNANAKGSLDKIEKNTADPELKKKIKEIRSKKVR